ncbi:MAG: hypothetical protein PVJ76_17630 [Gemmatimonadota bacterium]|jgi:hypothetical protein
MRRIAAGPLRQKLLLLGLGPLALLAASGCQGDDPFRVVTLQTEGEDPSDEGYFTLNFFPHVFVPAEEGDPVRIPLRFSDQIAVDMEDDGAWLPILASDGDTLVFDPEGALVQLNGTPVYLDLGDTGSWEWLGHATPEEKQSLRLVMVRDSLTPTHDALLEDLASHNPTLHLYTDERDLLGPLLSHFNPEGLGVIDMPISDELALFLSQEPELRSLIVSGYQLPSLAFLSQISGLEQLTIGDWDPEKTGPLPGSLSNLKSLVLIETDLANLAALGERPGLEELTIWECSGDEESGQLDVRGISNLPNLRFLSFRDCGVADLSPLAQLPDLEWLVLPPGLTQPQLESVVDLRPNLIFLELFESEEITDLTPLTHLTKLQGLLIGSGAPPEPLFEMDHLQYLAIMEDEGSGSFESGVVTQLKAELPTTTVGRVEPFCLGSGLILLLIPLTWMFLAFLGLWKGKRLSTARHD